MKSNLVLVGTVGLLCAAAFYCGRALHCTRLPAISQRDYQAPTNPAFVPPPDFGHTIYCDIASLSFADLYEEIRKAPNSARLEWLRQIEEMPESWKKISAICAFFRALVQADPNAAADFILQVKRHRGPAIQDMVCVAPPAAMPRLAEVLLNLPHAAREFNLSDNLARALDQWAQIDPEAVLRFIEEHKRADDDEVTVENKIAFQQYGPLAIGRWAGIDHEAAFKWIEQQSPEVAEAVRGDWIQGWFEADRAGAINYALAHLEDRQMGDALSWFATDLFMEGEARVANYLNRLPTSELRRDALNSIAHQVGSSDAYPAKAVADLIVQFPISEWPEQFGSVIEHWLLVSPNDLLGWIRHLPPEGQTTLIQQYPVPSLYPPDSEQYLLPILKLPPSDFRTKLLQSVVPRLKNENPPVRQLVNEMKISAEYKEEIRPLLPDEDSGISIASPEPEEAQ